MESGVLATPGPMMHMEEKMAGMMDSRGRTVASLEQSITTDSYWVPHTGPPKGSKKGVPKGSQKW